MFWALSVVLFFYSSPRHFMSSGGSEVCDLPKDLKQQQTASVVSTISSAAPTWKALDMTRPPLTTTLTRGQT